MPNNRKIYRVLVFPGGTEIGLEIFASLNNLKDVVLFSCTSGVHNHAEYMFGNNTVIKDVYTPGWIDDLNHLIKENNIGYIYPANPLVIDALSENRHLINAFLILPDHPTVKTLRSKKATYALFDGEIPVPALFPATDKQLPFPVFAKPDQMYGSQQVYLIESAEEMELFRQKPGQKEHLVMEYLPGNEYTADCLSGKNGNLLYCQARTRERIRMGTSMHSEFVSGKLNDFFTDTAKKILQKLPLWGAWFFQMKADARGTLKLLEIECRIAGTMALNRVAGVNFPLLSLYISEDLPVRILVNHIHNNIDRALKNKYKTSLRFKTAYVDLDDTILVDGKVNTGMIKLLYQFFNQGIRIVLLSKSLAKEKDNVLKEYRLHALFDEIHWLGENESKADYINDPESIYIDDSFSQRLEVAEKKGIPTFDLSMVEVLTD